MQSISFFAITCEGVVPSRAVRCACHVMFGERLRSLIVLVDPTNNILKRLILFLLFSPAVLTGRATLIRGTNEKFTVLIP